MSAERPFRLAFRLEGDLVNAYFAPTDSMEGAVFVASISKAIADRHFDRWKDLMKDAFGDFVEETTGVRPTWSEEPAPEHERAGRS